ncbi:META domain-containing protein [Kribbella sp. CA-294648]|uniref:META domain-containing protein n=1 Tax=Kribbella sp. CA-294648 TaxID=3239948 RepID=UPI003D8E1766
MSKTELEEELRATFERAAASVPLAADLAGRAANGAHHAQRRTWLVSGTAAAAVAVIAVVGSSLHGSSQPTSEPAASSPTTAGSTEQAPATTAQTVAGTWRPQVLAGFTTLKAGRPEDPIITFKADGTWVGSDGCNSLSGTYSIGQRGEFSSQANGHRLIGCDNVPHTAVLAAAKRISADTTSLAFYAGDGREVARYARAR